MDETRDESFALLSSMSPKIDKGKKKATKKKAPSRLALKHTIRRSSFYDKLPPTLNNKNIEIVDGSTDNSSDTRSSDKPTTIPISREENNILSQTKFTDIIKWMEGVQPNIEQDNQNISTFSTVSSIQGDLRADTNFGAINSTFADGVSQRKFDDFFEKVNSQFQDLQVNKKSSNPKKTQLPDASKKNVIDDTSKSLRKKKDIDDPLKPSRKKNENRVGTVRDSKPKKVLIKENEKFVTNIETKDPFEVLEKENVGMVENIDDRFKKKVTENPFKALMEPVGNGVGSFEKKEFESSFDALRRDYEEIVRTIDKRFKKKVSDEVKVDRNKFVVPVENIDNSFDAPKTEHFNLVNFGDKEFNGRSHENVAGKGNENYFELIDDHNSIPKGGRHLSQKEDEEVLIIEDSFEENKENLSQSAIGIEEDCLDILDQLYGDDWRKYQDQVLPQSEPRLRKPNAKAKEAPKTERKPRTLLKYQNPYLDSEKKRSKNVINILESARRKAALESPWVSKIKDLCDSESEDDPEPKNGGLRRVQLNFEETTPQNVCTKKAKGRGLLRNKLNFDEEETCKGNDGGMNEVEEGGKCKTNADDRKMKSRHLKTDYRDRKISSSSNDKCDSSSSDFDDIGLSLADKLKGKNAVKNTKLPRGRTLSSSSSSDNLENKDKTKGKKTERTQTKPRKISSSSSVDADENISDFENVFKRIDINAKDKKSVKKNTDTKPLSFLASLSQNVPVTRCDASAKIFKNCYKKFRQELLEKLFKMFNENIFDNSIPADMAIEWSDRMRGTAGYCACKKIIRRTGKVEREARLVLSTKVLDSADRLRDTLVHEMCHAATWIVNQVSDGHGPYWKSWAAKAMKTYPELPAIKRCHDYNITTKYTYRCTNCGYSFGRHSKSLDLNRKRCGHCFGTFEVLINKVTKDGEKKCVPATPKKEPTGFALFVKQNYALHKTPSLKHGEVMKILGTKFQETKVNDK